ncbi:MAG: phenylalanine--tRNA ligase subunit beta, partial [Muribaculaceae bacterium]|nr:phenylalanine--tRNA ligase subunit beta [Muribaculaceae bacterium]
GVRVEESPEWLRNRLQTIGLNPINNIVDITNFVLHAIGHPLHAFDASTLEGGTVKVRRASQGTKFTTLDGVERTLDAADLMICDANSEKCIAGVFGGLDSGVKDGTTTVFLESACFNATSVRRTARRHGISTDASFRYERGVDPNGCLYALRLAASLICSIAGGKPVGSIVDIYPTPVAPYHVDLTLEQINSLIGHKFETEEIVNILQALQIDVKTGDNGKLSLDVPTYRVDVRRPCDVIEDILRIYGYNRIPMLDELHSCLSFKTAVDAADDLRRTISEQLCGAGWNEILNNSLTAEAYYAELGDYPLADCVRLLNPLSQDLNVMRQTLLFGGLETIAHNINRRNADLALYEFGNVYFFNSAKESTAEHPLAPYREGERMALWLTGNTRSANWLRKDEQATFYDLRQAVANVLSRCGLSDVTMPKADVKEGGIFSQALAVRTARGAVIGHIGVVSANVLRKTDIKVPVYYAELDWHAIATQAAGRNALYAPLPKTQAVKRDLSLLLDKAVTLAEIEAAVREADKKILRSVELFDVYEGDKLPEGKKSYAISITLQDEEKTLQDKYIDKVMSKIIETLRRKFNAELR